MKSPHHTAKAESQGLPIELHPCIGRVGGSMEEGDFGEEQVLYTTLNPMAHPRKRENQPDFSPMSSNRLNPLCSKHHATCPSCQPSIHQPPSTLNPSTTIHKLRDAQPPPKLLFNQPPICAFNFLLRRKKKERMSLPYGSC